MSRATEKHCNYRLPLVLTNGGGGGARCGVPCSVKDDKSSEIELPLEAPEGYSLINFIKGRGVGNSDEE